MRIGLNCNLMDMHEPLKAKAVCHLKYIDALIGVGCVPIIIPPLGDRESIEIALQGLDGFCLIGGPDYLPEAYGEQPHPSADPMHARRHHFDLLLTEILLERTKLPILGVCGGHQLLSIARGGALIQDVNSQWQPPPKAACTLKHSDSEREGTREAGNVYRHEVRLKPGSRIAAIVGGERVLTNSYHHQAVRPERVGAGMIASGWTPDGVIEAIEAPGERFIVGIQWHPERMTEEPEHSALFAALKTAARTTGTSAL